MSAKTVNEIAVGTIVLGQSDPFAPIEGSFTYRSPARLAEMWKRVQEGPPRD